MIGLIEKVLRDCYGEPHIVHGMAFEEYWWNDENELLCCVLYKTTETPANCQIHSMVLQRVYGDAIGGSLLLGSAKLAMLGGPVAYELYLLNELRAQPEVRNALLIDPAIEFFMDAANVWFYGLKDEKLYVYDSGTGELNSLGPMEQAFSVLLQEWEEAKL